MDEAWGKHLLLTNNLMESCYRYVTDHPEKKLEEACKEYLVRLNSGTVITQKD